MTLEDTKKYSLFVILGIVFILGLLGAVVPDAREYFSVIVKGILALVPGLAG